SHVSLLGGNLFPHILLLPQAREHQFHAIGNPELIKDAEEVILHRMLGKPQLLPDFSIGETFHGQANDFRLSLGHAALYARIHLALLGRLREGVEHVSQFVITGPDLSLGDRLHGLAQEVEGTIAAKHAIGAEAERFDDQVGLGSFESHQGSRFQVNPPYFGQEANAGERPVLQIGANYSDLRTSLFDAGEDFSCRRSGGDHLKSSTHDIEGLLQKVALHFIWFGDKNRCLVSLASFRRGRLGASHWSWYQSSRLVRFGRLRNDYSRLISHVGSGRALF